MCEWSLRDEKGTGIRKGEEWGLWGTQCERREGDGLWVGSLETGKFRLRTARDDRVNNDEE